MENEKQELTNTDSNSATVAGYTENAGRYFLDTEFIERPNTIELISIGIKCEDGRKYYAISNEFDEAKASEWVKENVIGKLESLPRKSLTQIKIELLEFIKGDKIEFWGYYSDYDWTVFSWIFGRMVDLPKNFPMFCYDLRQWLNHKGLYDIKQPDDAPHNALLDAEWICNTYKKYSD